MFFIIFYYIFVIEFIFSIFLTVYLRNNTMVIFEFNRNIEDQSQKEVFNMEINKEYCVYAYVTYFICSGEYLIFY